MTRQRRGYVIALAVAVLALILSVGSAIGFVVTHGTGPADSRRCPLLRRVAVGPGAGMMGGQGWDGGGMVATGVTRPDATVAPSQAQAAAAAWVAANQPGTTLNDKRRRMPMGYLFTVTKDGVSVGTIVVNDDTGQVTWWQRATPATPSPSSLAS